MKKITFRKVRNKQEWKANNGTTIRYDKFSHKKYEINRGTFFKFADTLEDAITIAKTDCRFNYTEE